ncbi:MAG: hypothetical protein ABIF77_19960, partial [bacterium]
MFSAARNCLGSGIGLLISLLVMAFCLGGAVTGLAYDCAEEMEQATAYYAEGYFEEAIELLNDCLYQPDLDSGTRGQAYRLLGMVYVASTHREQAKSAI